MSDLAYQQQRQRIEHYFDRTAAQAWERLTSNAPVGRIRATVRAGRDEMRATLMQWLPTDLHGLELLDAGCGTGTLSIEAAQHGAHVLGIDISARLVEVARQRATHLKMPGTVEFISGDMIDPARQFDHVIAMDSIIHYEFQPMLDVLADLCSKARRSVLFTVAPHSTMLATMHAVGKLFPRADRSPAIVPVRADRLLQGIAVDPRFADWRIGRHLRVHRGFYISEARELVR